MRCFFLSGIVLLVASLTAQADPFEKPRHTFRVRLAGQPVSDPSYPAALVFPKGRLIRMSFSFLPPEAQTFASRLAPMLEDGCDACCAIGSGEDLVFLGLMWKDLPAAVRLVVYLPSQDRWYVSDETILSRSMVVDLHEHGGGTLTRSLWGRIRPLAPLALYGTAIEVVVVLLLAWLTRQPLGGIAMAVAVAVNIVTIPALNVCFFASIDSLSTPGQGVCLLAGLEAFVVVSEAAAYQCLAGWKAAAPWTAAVLANLASFAVSLALLMLP